jgi:NADH-quinone oxidoreductase subunit J
MFMGFWEPLFFWIFAIGALGSSLAVLLFRNPLYSALALIVDFLCFAGLYVLLSAHFIAITQVLVYGGAIMVLFLFIIMLLNLSDEDLGPRRFSLHHVLAVMTGVGLLVFIASAVLAVVDLDAVNEATEAAQAERVERQAQAGDDELSDEEMAVAVPSAVPGLDAFSTEAAVQERFSENVRAWDRGETSYADRKYTRFDDTQPLVVPPILTEADRPTMVPEGAEAAPAGAHPSTTRQSGARFGTVEPVSVLLVNRFVVPFELTAVLLLAAIIGAVIIAKKRL